MKEIEAELVLKNHAEYANAAVIDCNTMKKYKVKDAINTILKLYDEEKEKNKQLELENKELKGTLKCTQNSWYDDTKILENYKNGKFEIRNGGRTNGQTLENAVTFLHYLDELETNKMYGISKCGNITLLTKTEVISKAKIEKMIEKFKMVREEILKKLEPRLKYDLDRNDYCEKMLQELLEK